MIPHCPPRHLRSRSCVASSKRVERSVHSRWAMELFLVPLLFTMGCNRGTNSVIASTADRQGSSADDAEQLGPEAQASLQAILTAGSLPDMRWPDFSDYRGDVAKFYGSYDGELPWVRDM